MSQIRDQSLEIWVAAMIEFLIVIELSKSNDENSFVNERERRLSFSLFKRYSPTAFDWRSGTIQCN
ncbi:MAG: hypothetical protein OXI87_03510 [Albidovulum sp.]|nr:hypothetical protein [Albidovulum sp.]